MPACDLDAWLLDCGFPAQGYDATIDNQTTPLMKASHVGDAAIVNLLIQRGVSVNARNSDGNNALWFACISTDLAVLGLLVDAGIDLDNRNDNQATCLMYAASTGKAEVLSKLTHAGADRRWRSMLDTAIVGADPDQSPIVAYSICGLNEISNRRAKAFQLLQRAADGSHKAFSIFVVRWGSQVFGYVNRCPHNGGNLDWERDQFLDPSGLRLMCGKHGSLFEIGTGCCVEGPCQGQGLEPVSVAVIDGDVCVNGVELVVDDAAEVGAA